MITFLAIGPQKTASTWVYECLRISGQVCLPAHTKETFFWDEHYDRGIDWYVNQFPVGRQNGPCGEIGPTYFENSQARERIRRHRRDCKIIVTLRDPAARAYSLYLHHWKKGRISASPAVAFDNEPWLLAGSRYSQHLPAWIDDFGIGNVLILLQEDIAVEPATAYTKICEFIGLDGVLPHAGLPGRVNGATAPRWPLLAKAMAQVASWARRSELHRLVNAGKALGLHKVYQGGNTLPTLDPTTRLELTAKFEKDIDYVERVLHRTLDDWRTAS